MTEDMRPTGEICRYSAAHTMDNVPATRMIDCGAVGMVPGCEACALLFQRLAGGRTDASHEGSQQPGNAVS